MGDKRVELLAPAGNLEAFYGAIHAGADAVYLAGNRFGARAYADNFSTEELVGCIRYAHLWGKKVYLTVNTLVKESEFNELFEYLLPFYEAGLDGVIIQDIGVFAYLKEHFPSIELHVSTQMTLTGKYGAKLLQDMGACRIVPARELSLKEIRHLKETTNLEIECFIHGAMCYCYSGQCLFSSILGGRSGNRGRCAQPCRLPYQVYSKKNGCTEECYPLSLKDMCTIEHIPELIEAGIDSFKIEGRMKKPEYAAGVTAIYRKYIDKYYYDKSYIQGRDEHGKQVKSEDCFRIESSDMRDLSCLYIRSERQNGYYYKHNGKDMVTLGNPAYNGSDEKLLQRIRELYLDKKPKKEVAIYASFFKGEKATVTFVVDELSVTVEGDVVQAASKQPVTEENIKKQLRKLGESIFVADVLEVSVEEDVFYPLKAINELRREAVTKLEDLLLTENSFAVMRTDAIVPTGTVVDITRRKLDATDVDLLQKEQKEQKKQTGRFILSLNSKAQLKAAVQEVLEYVEKIPRIYVNADILVEDELFVFDSCTKLAEHFEVVLALPYIIRKRDREYLSRIFSVLEENKDIFSGILVRSLDGMGIIQDRKYQGKIYTDAGFYIWNRKTLFEWADKVTGVCLPYELKSGECRGLTQTPIPCEKIVYGRIPMMITANCVANSTMGCVNRSGEDEYRLIDRYRKSFPVELNCIHCMNIIYNTIPLSLHGELPKWREHTDFRINFTIEDENETKEILKYFCKIQGDEAGGTLKDLPYKEYTTGHEKRGVE